MEFEALALWDLNRMLYDSFERDASREARRMAKLRHKFVDRVVSLFATRRAAQLELVRRPPADEIELLRAELKIAELTAQLDALTGGMFSRRLRPGGSIGATPSAPR
jgi:hypothetical protein